MFATDTSSTTKKMKGDEVAEIVQSLLSGGFSPTAPVKKKS